MGSGNTAIVAIVTILVLVIVVFFVFFGGFSVFQRDTSIDVEVNPPVEVVPVDPGDQNGEEAPQNYYHLPFSFELRADI